MLKDMNNMDENKSFEYVDVIPAPVGVLYRGTVKEVKLTGNLSLHYSRLDLASRGLITTPESRYIEPDGSIFHFSN